MTRLARLAFRLTLLLYPARFRTRYAEEMRELFAAQLGEATRRAGWRGAAASVVRSLRAAPRSALEVWSARVATSADARRGGVLENVLNELWAALRGLRRNPVFSAMAVGSLALGMGANATVLTAVHGLLWRELPIPEPASMVRLFEVDSHGPSNVSWPNYAELRDQATGAFEGILVHDLRGFGLRTGDRTQVIHGEVVSSNYFDVLRLQPAAGELFRRDDSPAGGAPLVAVISHHLWQTRFGGERSVPGRLIELSGQPVRIAGVAPDGFQGTKFGLGMDVWVPVRPWVIAQGGTPLEEQFDSRWLNAVARLRPGIGLDEARAAVDTVASRLAQERPETNLNTTFSVTTEATGNFGGHGEQLVGPIGDVALLAAALVMLVACGNVAGLLLARGASRQREMAVRRALGAGRGRILRHFLAEGAVVAAAATVLGLLLSRLAAPLLTTTLPPLPYRFVLDLTPDLAVLAGVAASGAVAAVVCGVSAALGPMSEHGLALLLPQGRGSAGPARLRPLRALAGLTLAFCCVTLVLGGLFARSLAAARGLAPGFETRSRATASADVALAGPDATPPERFYRELLAGLRRTPGVRFAAVASNMPLSDRQDQSGVFDARHPAEPDDPGLAAWTAWVSDDWFDAMGQRIVAGRGFQPTDRDPEGPWRAVIGRTTAERLFGDASAVGRSIRTGSVEVEVVGVVADARYQMINETPRAALYLPFWRNPQRRAEVLVAGPEGAPAPLGVIPAAAGQVDPAVPVYGEKTLSVHVAGSLWMFRLAAGLAAALGVLAALLALAGLYGVMAYGVHQRRPEIGIRLALGATRSRIVRGLMGGGARLAATGVAAGLAAAAAAAELVRGLLVGVSAHDPVAFAAVGLAVIGFALLACLVPSLAASRTDPAHTLRSE